MAEPGTVQTLELDGWMPTLLNVLMRMERHRRSRALDADARVVALEAAAQGLTRAYRRRRVSLTIRYRPGRTPCDPDACFKSLLDALRKCGAIRNDCPLWLELGPVTYEAASRRGIVVTLEDVPDDPCLGPPHGRGRSRPAGEGPGRRP